MNAIITDALRKYATENHCDIVKPSIESKGYMYFYLNMTVRPRYLGHPHIIKISQTGKVHRVLDVDEIYWAFKYALQQRTGNLSE